MSVHVDALRGSFHEAIGPVLKFSQFFGLIPVDHIDGNDISRINFRWKSIKSIYSLVFIVCGTLEGLLLVKLLCKRGVSLGYASAFGFLFISLTGAYCLFNLATKWHRLMNFWYETEKVFLKAPYKLRGWSMKHKIRLWAAVVGILALGNYSFIQIVHTI